MQVVKKHLFRSNCINGLKNTCAMQDEILRRQNLALFKDFNIFIKISTLSFLYWNIQKYKICTNKKNIPKPKKTKMKEK
jgi:hypothetical protein